MSCEKCIGLTVGGAIKMPADLRNAIGKIANAVRAGVLQCEARGQGAEPFSRLAAGGLWGDFVSNYFTCRSCGQLFHLRAETYRGSGGALAKIGGIDERIEDDVYEDWRP